MGVLRKSGSTRISLPGLETPGSPPNEFLDAVRDVAAAEQFEILGEMGQGKDLSIVYLARDMEERRLVALRFEPGAGDEYLLEVVQQLDSSIPSVEGDCPRCGAPPRGWGRFCTRCGVDLSGVASAKMSKAELLEAANEPGGDNGELGHDALSPGLRQSVRRHATRRCGGALILVPRARRSLLTIASRARDVHPSPVPRPTVKLTP